MNSEPRSTKTKHFVMFNMCVILLLLVTPVLALACFDSEWKQNHHEYASLEVYILWGGFVLISQLCICNIKMYCFVILNDTIKVVVFTQDCFLQSLLCIYVFMKKSNIPVKLDPSRSIAYWPLLHSTHKPHTKCNQNDGTLTVHHKCPPSKCTDQRNVILSEVQS